MEWKWRVRFGDNFPRVDDVTTTESQRIRAMLGALGAQLGLPARLSSPRFIGERLKQSRLRLTLKQTPSLLTNRKAVSLRPKPDSPLPVC
jgi:hypothetical protein